MKISDGRLSPEQANQDQLTVKLSFGSGTDRGLRRELNEDSLLAADPLFAVADGMGGHEAGELASRECIQVLSQQAVLSDGSRAATAADLQAVIERADHRIRELSDAKAGTTLTGVAVVEERSVPYWLVFNIGDSRTYRLNQGVLTQVSVDHSEVQELVDGGYLTPEQAQVHPRRHVVTRALGTGADSEADYWLVPMEEGDRVLVCSDGLTDEIEDQQIARMLLSATSPQGAVDSLIHAALRAGGKDNVSVVVVQAENVHSDLMAETLNHDPHGVSEDTLPRDIVPAAPDRSEVQLSEPEGGQAEQPLETKNSGENAVLGVSSNGKERHE